jgi:hypothetical protein
MHGMMCVHSSQLLVRLGHLFKHMYATHHTTYILMSQYQQAGAFVEMLAAPMLVILLLCCCWRVRHQ